MTRLGEMLVQQGKVSPEALAEALAAQVVHGGRLGTNLLELGHITEAELAKALGAQHGVAFAAGEMEPDPKALALVTTREADDKDLLPMRIDGTRVSVAVMNPQDLGTLDAIAFRTGRRVIRVVVSEFRMNQLLRRHAKAFRPLRAVDLNGGKPPKKPTGPSAKASAPATELMSEEEFQALYAQALGNTADEPEEEILEGVIVSDDEPSISQPGAPEPSPLSFPQAQAALAMSSNREDVARTVLRFARSQWRRCLLLSVQGGVVTGWHGLGEGLKRSAMRRIGIPLGPKGTFRLVVETRSHYVGKISEGAATDAFFAALGGGRPTTAVMLPLLVRGKVVHLLYLDDGPGKVTPPNIAELLILSQSVARSYEEMIRKRSS